MLRWTVLAALLPVCVLAWGCADRETGESGSQPSTAPDAAGDRPIEAAAAGRPSVTTQPDGPAVRVIAMNIESARRATVGKIAGRMAEHRPDVVLLAEVSDLQADQLARLLALHRAATAGLADQVGGVETAVLCRWPVSSVRLISSPQRTFAVMAATTRPAQDDQPALPMHLIAIHQRSTHPGPVRTMIATTRQRAAETGLLLAAVEKLAGPIIVGGDFNEGADSFSLGRLDERFDNAFSRAGRGSPVTFPGFASGIRIDHIYHTRELAAADCFVDPTYLSDHRMVVATIRLPAPRSGGPRHD